MCIILARSSMLKTFASYVTCGCHAKRPDGDACTQWTCSLLPLYRVQMYPTVTPLLKPLLRKKANLLLFDFVEFVSKSASSILLKLRQEMLMNSQTGTHVEAPSMGIFHVLGTLRYGTPCPRCVVIKLLRVTRRCEVEDASDGLLQGGIRQDRVSYIMTHRSMNNGMFVFTSFG